VSTRLYLVVGASTFFPLKSGKIIGVDFFSPLAAGAATCVVTAGVLEGRTIPKVAGSDPATDYVAYARFDGGTEEKFSTRAISVPITEKTCLGVTQDAIGSAVITVEE